ncbi:hypothetical protein [Helicobacter fennelliae]|nr:hypothetical protein [Helicobacter fennelliae]
MNLISLSNQNLKPSLQIKLESHQRSKDDYRDRKCQRRVSASFEGFKQNNESKNEDKKTMSEIAQEWKNESEQLEKAYKAGKIKAYERAKECIRTFSKMRYEIIYSKQYNKI